MVGTVIRRLGPGDRVGLYTIESELAKDTTGISYRGVHQVLPRRAVIKVMHAASVYPPVIKQPLAVHVLREACILEALHHPGVIRLFESGMLGDKRPWFARELVEGASLASVLAPGTIDRVDALALLRDVSGVLDQAYRRGIIHCGLRPDRIMLTSRTRGYPICITDWGEARTHDAKPSPYAPSLASWPYTSPELVVGDPIDDRTDVFALGVIAYQLFTSRLPFGGEGITHLSRHVPTAHRCPGAPRELAKLVDSMLAYDRWDRPSVFEVHGELAWLADMLAAPVARHEPLGPASIPDLVRIRRPRWTPQDQLLPRDTEADVSRLVGDELDPDRR